MLIALIATAATFLIVGIVAGLVIAHQSPSSVNLCTHDRDDYWPWEDQ